MSIDSVKYQFLLDNISGYILVPRELTNMKDYTSRYVVYRKYLLDYVFVSLPDEDIEEITDTLIQTGIEIRNKPIDWEYTRNLERLWTDLVDILVLVPSKHWSGVYTIYHKELDQSFTLQTMSTEEYQRIINRMIQAGVEIQANTNKEAK